MLPLRIFGPVVQIGNGDLGGKARVLPFLQRLLDQSKIQDQFSPHTISVPETWVLSTDCFVDFVARNHLDSCADLSDDNEVRKRFLAGSFSDVIVDVLAYFLNKHTLPLAVRSSALNEDTHHSASAGLFSTLFIPNRGPDRLRQLQEAIKLVFASAFYRDVNHFLLSHSIPREEGQMAVAIEEVVGTTRGNIHYPLVAGVAQSINFFPVGEMRAEDGVATLVVGLGSRAVSGRDGVRFCPAYPTIRPSFQLQTDIQRSTQTVFDAVNLDACSIRLQGEETETITRVPIKELDGYDFFPEVASVYDPESGIFYESFIRSGHRLITFNRLLRGTSFPLPEVIRKLVMLVQEGFGSPAEIEFAMDLRQNGSEKYFKFVLLQGRPLPSLATEKQVDIPEVPEDKVLMKTDRALGHGTADHLRHIVFVDPHVFSLDVSNAIAQEVAMLNEQLQEQGQQYILLGPGRWGSCNRAVGIPVNFRQIDRARLVAELSTARLQVEPSQGTHFFHNMVSRDLFFLTVDTRLGHRLNLEWLREQPNLAQTRFAKLIQTSVDVSIRIDATQNTALVFLN